MSRIGNKPIPIPAAVQVEQRGRTIRVSGPKGILEMECHPAIQVRVDSEAHRVVVSNPEPTVRSARAMHGTMRALLNNMVNGVSQGFRRTMQIYGTGYNVKEQGGTLVLNVGHCHPVSVPIPKTVKVEIQTPATRGNDVPAVFTCSGPDKRELGQFLAEVRKVRPPEPYQGKGIRFADEVIRRKAGKAFTSGS